MMAEVGISDSRDGSAISPFELAADAIISGDIATLRQLLREKPSLARSCSAREHNATLLHYVAANGVEDYRQRTPVNIVEIANLLLDSGAKIDAVANLYGGSTTLSLAATSVHPERAGVQEALLETLLQHGAKIDHPGASLSLVTACLANGRLKAAEFFAHRVTHLDIAEAAALGRLDVLHTFFAEDGGLKSAAHDELVKQGFLYACQYGRNQVIEFLLGNEVDLASHDAHGQTGLHWAVIGGHFETIKLLLKHRAPLEVKNSYGGSVLDQALWSAAHGGNPEIYIEILKTLEAEGAIIPERHPSINKPIDQWLQQHGSHAVPDWHW